MRPNWIKVRAPQSKNYFETTTLINKLKLNTVCKAAACPNIGECWDKKHATVMILGSICCWEHVDIIQFLPIRLGYPRALMAMRSAIGPPSTRLRVGITVQQCYSCDKVPFRITTDSFLSGQSGSRCEEHAFRMAGKSSVLHLLTLVMARSAFS